ncbi:MAG: hypothetical protein C5B57_11610, partial [Blastocatellia bacterium]
MGRHKLFVVLSATTLAALIWMVAVWATGGFVWETPLFRLSSRDPFRPMVIAVLCGIAAWHVAPPPDFTFLVRIQRAVTFSLAPSIAIVGSGLLVYQWLGARPMWVDEEMIALNVRDRTLTQLTTPLWLDQSAPFGWLALER